MTTSSPSSAEPTRRQPRHPLPTRRRYRLSFINENTLHEVWTVGMSQRKVVASVLLLFFALGCMAATLIVFTPLRTLLPGYLKQEERHENAVNVYRVDSLLAAARAANAYLSTIGTLLRGDSLAAPAVAAPASDHVISPDSLLASSEAERLLADAVEERKRYTVGSGREAKPAIAAIFHFPVAGAERDPSSTAERLVARAPRGAAVTAPGPATVVDVSYSPAGLWAVMLQHPNGYLTRISGMASAKTTVAAHVAAGETIGIAGGSMPLAVELWSAGSRLDPTRFMPM